MPTKFSYEFDVRIGGLLKDLAALTSVAASTEKALRRMGEAAAAVNLSQLGKGLDIEGQANAMRGLLAQLEKLNNLQNKLNIGRARNARTQQFTGPQRRIAVPEDLQTTFPSAPPQGVSAGNIANALREAQEEVEILEQLMRDSGGALVEGVNEAKILLREAAVTFETLGAAGFEKTLQNILNGQGLQEAANRRLIKLEERRLSIIKALGDAQNLIERAGGGRFADRISKEAGQLTDRRRAASERVLEAEAAVAKFQASGNTSRSEGLRIAQKLTDELQKQQKIESDATANRGIQRSLDVLKDESGLGPVVDELQLQLQGVNEQIVDLEIGGPEAFAQLEGAAPGVTAEFEKLRVTTAGLQTLLENRKGVDSQSDAFGLLSVRIERAEARQKELIASTREFQNVIGESSDVEILDPEALKANLGFLEKTLVGAFDGFARRFQATLQFALSAAIIFGVQKLARELLSTAIEVERAFADIESALEFDIGFDRGTAEFASEVEEVRQGVLAAANDLNVLPTVANEIAFKMVARFRDIDNAIIATRAQMLALKISTIDSAEVLRALTAVAEGFAAATIVLNQDLSLQERLLRQESAALLNYTRALDLATQIQQTWGVEVEDSLEGTARATEVFSQLGFSLEETMAIVAAVTVRLGQTGQVLAEKLVRSIGQITSPQIRDQLLDLAVASEALNLTFEDFESGAGVLRKLLDQFERIEQLEPETANRLFQIIGQRREVEVVATVLGTRDIQDDIIGAAGEAAGAAERRFGFLRSTIAEVLASLAVGFEEFAQNLAVLGTLGPFKLLISTADQLLQILNKILGTVIKMINILDELVPLGDLGFGTFLATLATVIISLATIKKALVAIGTTNLLLGGGKAAVAGGVGFASLRAAGAGAKVGGRTASLVALQGIAAVAKPLEAAIRRMTTGFVNGAKSLILQFGRLFHIRAINTSSIEVETKARLQGIATLGDSSKASLLFFGKLAVFVALITVVVSFVGAIFESRRALEEWTEAVKLSKDEVERKIIEEDITDPLDIAVVNTAAVLANVEAITDQTTGFGESMTSVFQSLSSLSEKELELRRDFFLPRARRAGITAAGREDPHNAALNEFVRRSLKEGTSESFDLKLARAVRDSLLATMERSIVDATHLVTQTSLGKDPTVVRALSELQTQQLSVARLFAEARTEDEFAAATAAGVKYEKAVLSFERRVGINAAQTEESLNNLRRDLDATQSDIKLGRVGGAEGLAQLDDIRDRAQFEADRRPEGEDKARFIAIVEETNEGFQSLIQENFDRKQAVIDLLEVESEAIRQKVDNLKGIIKQFTTEKNFKAAQDAWIEMVKAQRELVDSLIGTAQDNLALANSFANGIEDQIAAQKVFVATLRELFEIDFPSGGLDEIRDFERFAKDPTFRKRRDELIISENALNNLQDQAAIRRIVAEAQAAGPVLSQLTSLTSQLAGAKLKLKQATEGSIEAIEGLNEVQVTLANISRNLLEAAQAFVLLSAGVNDSMKKLKGEITNVALELEFARANIDTNSAEYQNLLARQNELRHSLAQAILSLRDLNRRLESDVTNAFEQAQLDLIQILEQLSAPDLGELEKKTLELEKKNAEAAAKSAFFDDKLFGLSFQFETGDIGLSQYINALESLLDQVDTSTDAGKKTFLEISNLIDSLTNDISDFQFNIPGAIRLPTLFEVRRSLAADQLGVNYQDNRTQLIQVTVEDPLTLDEVLIAIEAAFGADVQRVTAGNVGVTTGPF